MKRIEFFSVDGKALYFISTTTVKKEPGRSQILGVFSTDPETAYCETNVRRYTADDIYAGRKGAAI